MLLLRIVTSVFCFLSLIKQIFLTSFLFDQIVECVKTFCINSVLRFFVYKRRINSLVGSTNLFTIRMKSIQYDFLKLMLHSNTFKLKFVPRNDGTIADKKEFKQFV